MSENNFIGYEYQEVPVKHEMVSLYNDCYRSFGWELENKGYTFGKFDSQTMKFKRDRRIRNKAELTRLQRQFDAGVSEIEHLEFSKALKPSVVAYIIGIIGTAFMAGSVFAVVGNLIPLCIILAVPAFIGWGLSYFCYLKIQKKKTAEVAPLIDNKYDELYDLCEKANGLLAGA